MKITINIDASEVQNISTPVVEVQSTTTDNNSSYLNKPPYKGVMVVKAHRVGDDKKNAKVYEFRYHPEDYPEINGISKGVPLHVGYLSSVRVNPNQFHPTSKGLLPFKIIESDRYCGPNNVYYPVLFEVFDFSWEEK